MKKVLFIDDDEIYNFLMERKIGDEVPEIEAIFCDSGREGLNYLADTLAASEEPPAFIFLDVKMPEIDGFDFLNLYQKRDYHKSLPARIYMLTSSINNKDKEKAEAYSSVAGFINKPLKTEELKTIVGYPTSS